MLDLCQLRVGTSNHRALLFKLLANEAGIPCKVQQWREVFAETRAVSIVCLHGEELYVDLMHTPGLLRPRAGWDQWRHAARAGQCCLVGVNSA